MSSPLPSNRTSSSNAVTLTPETPLHISTVPLTIEAARSIMELVMSTRGSANIEPVSIPITAYPGVKQGFDQCMRCGIFGHREWQCAQNGRTAEPISDWRRTKNGKIYSVRALLGMHPYQKWTMDTLLEDNSSQDMYDHSPSATPTPLTVSNTRSTESDSRTTGMKTQTNPPNPPLTKSKPKPSSIGLKTPNREMSECYPRSPTPPAPSSSSSAMKRKKSSESKTKGGSHVPFNPVVTPWNDWSKVWSWSPKHQCHCCCCYKRLGYKQESFHRHRRAGSCPMEE
ncbi:hypothetical protein DFH28DRAFT_887812 [Melampsora americana]|nr:hypothetical protein DFH28DRAFT_887812 [Melampsora americana]